MSKPSRRRHGENGFDTAEQPNMKPIYVLSQWLNWSLQKWQISGKECCAAIYEPQKLHNCVYNTRFIRCTANNMELWEVTGRHEHQL